MVGMALVTTVPSKALTTSESSTDPVASFRASPGRPTASSNSAAVVVVLIGTER
jgi:hypothetical protein